MNEQRVTEGNRGGLFAEPQESEAGSSPTTPAPQVGEGEAEAAWEGYSLETLTSLLDS